MQKRYYFQQKNYITIDSLRIPSQYLIELKLCFRKKSQRKIEFVCFRIPHRTDLVAVEVRVCPSMCRVHRQCQPPQLIGCGRSVLVRRGNSATSDAHQLLFVASSFCFGGRRISFCSRFSFSYIGGGVMSAYNNYY